MSSRLTTTGDVMPCVVWVHHSDCDPPHGLDMESEHDRVKVAGLLAQFVQSGFDKRFPALIGYPDGNGRIQLLSGTHRHKAAEVLDTMMLPVTLWLRSDVESSWGLEDWLKVMKDVPVQELESWTREDVEKHRSIMRRRNHLDPPSNPFVE